MNAPRSTRKEITAYLMILLSFVGGCITVSVLTTEEPDDQSQPQLQATMTVTHP